MTTSLSCLERSWRYSVAAISSPSLTVPSELLDTLLRQIIRDHSELQLYIGLDVDPVAHEKAQSQIYSILNNDLCNAPLNLKTHTLLKNFKYIKSALREVDGNLLESGVDGILLDLGLSSMQVDNVERGFSVLNNGPLDMRMNTQVRDRQV